MAHETLFRHLAIDLLFFKVSGCSGPFGPLVPAGVNTALVSAWLG